MKCLNSIIDSMGKFQKTMKDRGVWCAVVHGFAKSQTQLSDWTITEGWKEISAFRGSQGSVILRMLWGLWGKMLGLRKRTGLEFQGCSK